MSDVVENGQVVGYSITFNDGRVITLRNGKDGQSGSGSVPQLSVRQDADGVWYWTINGEWLVGADGNRVPAAGRDGKDGKDGVTPLLKIENDYWFISYNQGTTWERLGKATGASGQGGTSGQGGGFLLHRG